VRKPVHCEAALIGYVLGDGAVSASKTARAGFSVTLYGNYEGDQEFATRLRYDFGWQTPFRETAGLCWALTVPHYDVTTLQGLGLAMPCNSYTKALPTHFRRWRKKQKRALLSGLWQTDGHVSLTNTCYTTCSGQLAHDVGELLKLLKISHTVRQSRRGEWYVYVHKGSHDRFSRTVRLYGKKHKALGKLRCKTFWTVFKTWIGWYRHRRY
jgi:hypothetical protein